MLLFRHDYLKKVDNFDPTWLEDFKPTIEITASKMYEKYLPNMNKVGLEIDDAILLSQLFTIYYMSLYSINKDEETFKKFEAKFLNYHGRMPNKTDQKTANKNQLINFIRQRFKHVNTLCSRKARNIICGSDVRLAFARTENTITVCEDEILDDHKKYGYRKITKDELKAAKEEAKKLGINALYDKDGFPIIEIERLSETISKNDFEALFTSSKNQYHNSPEATMSFKEDDAELKAYKEKFKRMNMKERRKVLRRFINENKGNARLKKEMKAAREMLKEIKNVV